MKRQIQIQLCSEIAYFNNANILYKCNFLFGPFYLFAQAYNYFIFSEDDRRS